MVWALWTKLLYFFNMFVLSYFIIVNGLYIVLTTISFIVIRRYLQENILARQRLKLFQTSFYKPISIIAPAFNEQATICDSVRSLLQLHYPEFEIIVVNDGSTDKTLEVVMNEYRLKPSPRPYPTTLPCKEIRGVYVSKDYPQLVVVDKVNGGKADALNAGINVSRYPVFGAIDSDSLLEHDVMLKLVRPFLSDPDTIAAGGIVRVANGCHVESGEVVEIGLSKKWLPNFQIVEYLRSFLFGRVGWDAMNGLVIISGAFGLFRKDAVVACGGYASDTVGEDMELVVRLHRHFREKKAPYRITFVPEPVCWTEVPENTRTLGRQRNRWQRGLADTIMRHRKMLFNKRYGVVGLLVLPFFLFFELLGPIIEFFGYIVFAIALATGAVNEIFAVLFFIVAFLLGSFLSLASLTLEELSFRKYPRFKHVITLFVFGLLENFGYRQIHAWWRLKGLWSYLRREKSWGAMERKGHLKKPST